MAARKLVSEQGYRATTTREIARRAELSEMTVFRHFETKVALFAAAVLVPLREFTDDQLSNRPAGRGAASTAEKMAEFLAGLLELALDDGDHPLLVAAAEMAQPDSQDGVAERVGETLTDLCC
ncbi:helix-turn-helix domain-containing protein [Mycolicibacterium neoaurum]|uniref:TetR/AcrR family transcriptional regulator n=1 Tax=Mycolicibacterium neoaurum TaxID=1795 RepID=UPI002671B06D|nr:TetR/AcrR family transcriptional regulator [Mycolicibacterium neoaurum]MDO3402774.1 helix-turn-helix domain-containing protein [Mycolicibacterium neoaurum]